MKNPRLTTALAVLLILFSLASYASAANPFRVRVRASFPQGMRTVGQAADHLLQTIDYKFVTEYPAPPEARQIAKVGISPLARSGEIMPLEDVLLLLVGSKNRVVVDHIHGLVTFEEIPGDYK